MKQYKDYQLKGQILQAIHVGISTAKDIYKFISYPYPLDNLYAELCFLNNYGYLSVEKFGRISHYSLTKKGVQHALNPNICQDVKKELEEVKLKRKLDSDPIFREAVTKYLTNNYPVPVETQNIVTQQVPASPLTPARSELATETPVEHDISEYNKHYSPEFKPVIYVNPNSERDFNNIDKTIDRKAEIKRRREIAMYYFDGKRGIYSNFFDKWGGHMKPYLLNDGSIEILSKSNFEHRRGHVSRVLLPKEYKLDRFTARFHISKITDTGIYITGNGMREPRFLIY